MISRRNVALLGMVVLLAGTTVATADILVYDENTNNQYAQTAAASLTATVVVGNASDFNTLLNSQTWEVVLVDCPSSVPSGGWTDLIAYVNGGGLVVMSFWDWDNDSGVGDPGLFPAFGYLTATSISLEDGVSTLMESATTAGATIFSGVPGMPHTSWFNSWGDDGDAYTFSGGEAVAELQGNPNPVTIVNPAGNAIATFLVDEWQGPGAVEFWEGMASYVQGAPMPTVPWPAMALLAVLLLSVGSLLLRYRRAS